MNYLTEQKNYRMLTTINKLKLLTNVAQLDAMNNEFMQENKPYFVIPDENNKQQLLQDIQSMGKIDPVKVLNTNYFSCNIICKKEKSKILLYCKDRYQNNYWICVGSYDFSTSGALNFITTQACLRRMVARELNSLSATPEWIWNYYDETLIGDVDNFIEATINLQKEKSCPVGYINYLKDNNCLFSDESYFQFILNKCLVKLPEYQRNIMGQLANIGENRYGLRFIHDWFIQNNIELLTTICKIMLCDIKNLIDVFYITENLQNMISVIIEYHEKICPDSFNKIIDILDTNRGIKYNMNNIQNLLNAELNDKIKKQQSKIFCFDKYRINKNLICIIPTTLNELQDEGTQQNNCVGSYYNDNIIDGDYKICFVRHIEKPTKSYITCRIDNKGNIIEARYKNNGWVNKADDEILKDFSEKQLQPYYKKYKI